MEVSGSAAHALIESHICADDNASEACSVDLAFDENSSLIGNSNTDMFSPKSSCVRYSVSLEPYAGMEFESLDSARSFYCSFAAFHGFEVRVSFSHRSKRGGNIIAQQFVCSREGFCSWGGEGLNRWTSTNVTAGCHASLTVKRAGPARWIVKNFEKEHNHELVILNQSKLVQDFNLREAGGGSVIMSGSILSTRGVESVSNGVSPCRENGMEQDSKGRDFFVTGRDANVEPYVGMVFESEVETRSFYNAYARRVGFGTRINYSHRSRRDKSLIAQQYVCDREGFRMNREGEKKRNRVVTRVGCKALLNVRKVGPGIWVVKTFEKEHNHPLVNQTQVQRLRSHKGAQEMPKNQMRNIHKGVTQSLLEYFKLAQNENTGFFYATQLDNEGRVINAFWVDAICRLNYIYFGDAVMFDTSYLMKRYSIPFAPFIGRNHHNHPLLFGCALLTEETESSYTWLFRTWLSAMSGRPPVSIVTDYNRTIHTAVSKVFPESQHQFCIWNIERRLPEKLSVVCRSHKNFKEEFQHCIYDMQSPDDFEIGWASLLEKFDLKKNDWLQMLYEDRKYWVPAYLKCVFLGTMPTKRPGECFSSFFDEYVSAGSDVVVFIRQYSNMLDNLHHKEVESDYETTYALPNLKTSSPMEKQAAAIYTREMFKVFQVELFECFGYVAKRMKVESSMKTFRVAKFGEEINYCTVEFDFSEMRGTCSCRMFEHLGILCRHVLNVFRVANIFMLPDHYILKRWTRNAKIREMLDEGDSQEYCHSSLLMRFNDLCRRFVKIAEDGAKSVEGYRAALWGLQHTMDQCMTVNESAVGFTQPAHVGGISLS